MPIVSVGPFAVCCGNALPPTTNRFETSQDYRYLLTTLVDGSLPITAPPTLCVLWYPVMPKCVPLFVPPRREPLSARPISMQRSFMYFIMRRSLSFQSNVMRNSDRPYASL